MDQVRSKYFLEYKGPAAKKEMEAGKLGNALIGLQDGIKKVCKEEKSLEEADIVVVTNKEGSFVVDLIVGVAVATVAGLVANRLEKKLRVFTEQFRIKKFVKRKKHKAIPRFKTDEEKQVEIINHKGEEIYVSSDAYEIHQSKIIDKDISRIVEALEEEKVISLKVGIPDTKFVESVNIADKPAFVYAEDQELPELEDQEEVVIDGEIISFNKKRKSIGFVYKDKTINCRPAPGKNIIDFIEFAKLSNVRLYGKVHRLDKDKAPVIYIQKIGYIQPPFNLHGKK